MIPQPLKLPPDRCLSDEWPAITRDPALRRRWLAVVQAEATAVAAEAAAYRNGRPVRPVLSPAEAGAAWDRERAEAAKRGLALDRRL